MQTYKLGDRLLMIFQDLGWTNTEAAQFFGVDKSAITRWSGWDRMTGPRKLRLKPLEDKLGVSLIWLETGLGEKFIKNRGRNVNQSIVQESTEEMPTNIEELRDKYNQLKRLQGSNNNSSLEAKVEKILKEIEEINRKLETLSKKEKQENDKN